VARKNPFANLADVSDGRQTTPAPDYAMKGASRSILNTIDEIAARADRLIEGETIVDLDPESVDASFVRDRLATDGEEFLELMEAIRERGQDSPILVRPHPSKSGRYMVVFGHRRLEAARLLGRKVRAVVKEMKDREHVIAQGQENSARANLSFIEKASFALRLAQLQYDSDNATVMAALGIDRTTLSKMLSVAGLPEPILHAIGPAKAVGRDRWYELKLLLEKPSSYEIALRVVAEDGFTILSSEERFHFLVGRLKATKKSQRPSAEPLKRVWTPDNGALSAEMASVGKHFTLALKAKSDEATMFGRYLSENLARFYEVFKQESASNRNGD
jgi:ParB family chromosome partitioning protein